ncbi:MAG: hypothetical protein BGO52_16315 [Sphingobacteriales bacterium 44-61]|nr:MAG: hypothetical protein BGO52_16315 [Sphingobacteriales bacterium 44-61]
MIPLNKFIPDLDTGPDPDRNPAKALQKHKIKKTVLPNRDGLFYFRKIYFCLLKKMGYPT